MAKVEKIQRVAPAREIKVDLQVLYETLLKGMRAQGRAQGDINALPELTKLFESIMAYEYFDEARLVKSFFYYLSAGARARAPSADWLRESAVPAATLDASETQFLDQLVRLLLTARYKPLSNTEWLVRERPASEREVARPRQRPRNSANAGSRSSVASCGAAP
jgi:hypothetical protein